MEPAGRATWHPLAQQAPPEESGTPGSSLWHPSHSPSSHPPQHGAQELQGSVSGCAASIDSLSRTVQPFLPGQRQGAAQSRQVSINGAFHLTGEIKSLYREAQKR